MQAIKDKTSERQDDIAESIRQSLGTETVPILLSEMDVEKIGLRSAVSLRRDRCKGVSYLPYIKDPKGRIRYRLSDVIAVMAGNLNMPVVIGE